MDVRVLAALWRARAERIPRGPRSKAGCFLVSLLGLYALGAAFFVGLALGRDLRGLAPDLLGARLWRIPLALGAAGALWDGGCVVDARACRPWFVRTRDLVAAEALLGLTTPVKTLLGGAGLAFALGAGAGHPAAAPGALLVVFLVILWTTCLERILHVLVPAGLLRQRAFLAVALGLGGGLLALAAMGGPLRLPGLAEAERLWAWPGQHLVAFWAGRGTSHLLPPLAATLVLLALAGAAVAREMRGERGPGEALGGGRPWTFRQPWSGVLRLQFHQLVSSRAGQMRLLLLLLSVALAKEPELLTVGTLQTPRAWAALSAAVTFGAVLVVPLCNLLGFDRGGALLWWTAPVRARDVLLGKVAGCAAYATLAAPVLLALVARAQAWSLRKAGQGMVLGPAASPLGAGDLAALTLLLAALFFWWAGSGLARSLAAPWPMRMDGYGIKADFDEEKVARIGVLLAPLAWTGPLFALALAWRWWAAAAAAAALLAAALLRFRKRMDEASAHMDQRREAILQALG